jgi:hypothetical protein
VGPIENKPHKHPLEGLMGISLTYKSLCLDKKWLIRGLLVGLITSPSKPNTPLILNLNKLPFRKHVNY